MNTAQIALRFEAEKETRGTWRFAELVEAGDEPVCGSGTLYVRMSALAKLGNPEVLTVTIGPMGSAAPND